MSASLAPPGTTWSASTYRFFSSATAGPRSSLRSGSRGSSWRPAPARIALRSLSASSGLSPTDARPMTQIASSPGSRPASRAPSRAAAIASRSTGPPTAAAISTPSAQRPASRRVRGPYAARITGGGLSPARPTQRRRIGVPRQAASSPASSVRSARTYSSSRTVVRPGSPICLAVATPRPTPSTARPPEISLTVAMDAAMTAGFTGAGTATVVASSRLLVSRAAAPQLDVGVAAAERVHRLAGHAVAELLDEMNDPEPVGEGPERVGGGAQYHGRWSNSIGSSSGVRMAPLASAISVPSVTRRLVTRDSSSSIAISIWIRAKCSPRQR